MAWYEKANAHWPWLVSKRIDIVHFKKHAPENDPEGYNFYGAKLTFYLLGIHIGKEYLLHVNHGEPGWGLSWSEYEWGDTPGWINMTRKEHVLGSLDKWFEHIEYAKQLQKEEREREEDRGTWVGKYVR